MNLYPFQEKLVAETAKHIAKHRKVILQSSTGSGKTIMAAFITKRHLQQDSFNRVLFLTHRKELFDQSNSKIQTIAGVKMAKLQAGMRIVRYHSERSSVISMVETLKRRDFSKLGKFSLVIVDEAHRNDFNDILEKLPKEAYLLGLTATPISSNKESPLNDTYNSIVCGPSIVDLIQLNRLTTPIHYKAEFDNKGLRRRGGEFTSSSQMEKLDKQPVYENMVQLWKQHAKGRKTIVFNINKKHTIETDKQFKKHGIKSTHILSGDKQRDEKFQAFRQNKIDVVNMCEIGTTGLDIPDITCIVANLSTQSIVKWLQMLGRGGRIASKKSNCIFIDFGGNIDRHGMWHLQRNWKKLFYNPPEKTIAPAPMKTCDNCGAINFGGAGHCEVCGHKFKHNIQNKEQETVIGYLKKVGSEDIIGKRIDDLTIEQLLDLEKSGKYKPSFVARVARTRGEDELKMYAKLKGYSNGWLFHQRKMNTGYRNYKIKL